MGKINFELIPQRYSAYSENLTSSAFALPPTPSTHQLSVRLHIEYDYTFAPDRLTYFFSEDSSSPSLPLLSPSLSSTSADCGAEEGGSPTSSGLASDAMSSPFGRDEN